MTISEKPRKLYQYVVEALGKRIVSGEFAPGDQLHNEDELCREFEVSRGVVREATKVLIEKGLIVSRPKIGARVQPREEWNLFDPEVLSWTYATGDDYRFLRNMTEIRRVVEAEAARLAAERADDDHIDAIRLAQNRMAGLLADKNGYEPAEFIQADLAFHNAVLTASGNELIAQLGRAMRQALLTGRQIDRPDAGAHRMTLKAHQAILNAVARRDAKAAFDAARRHVDDVWQDIRRKYSEKKQ